MKNLFMKVGAERFEVLKLFPGIVWKNDRYMVKFQVRTIKDALIEIGYCIALWLALIIYVSISILNVFWLIVPRVYKLEE